MQMNDYFCCSDVAPLGLNQSLDLTYDCPYQSQDNLGFVHGCNGDQGILSSTGSHIQDMEAGILQYYNPRGLHHNPQYGLETGRTMSIFSVSSKMGG